LTCTRDITSENLSDIYSDDENDEESDHNHTQTYNVTSTDPVGNHLQFAYDDENGIKPEFAAALIDGSPFDFFSVFIDDEILSMMVDETNLYAEQLVTQATDVKPTSRLYSWEPAIKEEMKMFIGILEYMGMVQKPTIQHYCSKKKLFAEKIITSVISATGIVPQSLFKNLKILDLGNTLVVEIQKGILLFSCHIVRKFLNIDTEHNKTQQSQNVEARRR
jgi:hypothetical protein